MGYCIPIISWLAKFYTGASTLVLGWIFHMSGIPLLLLGMAITSIILYLSLKIFHGIGGLILMLIGFVGAFFSAGASLIISVIGLVFLISGEAAGLIVIGNILAFILAIICYI
jgi:hypothetical protein